MIQWEPVDWGALTTELQNLKSTQKAGGPLTDLICGDHLMSLNRRARSHTKTSQKNWPER